MDNEDRFSSQLHRLVPNNLDYKNEGNNTREYLPRSENRKHGAKASLSAFLAQLMRKAYAPWPEHNNGITFYQWIIGRWGYGRTSVEYGVINIADSIQAMVKYNPLSMSVEWGIVTITDGVMEQYASGVVANITPSTDPKQPAFRKALNQPASELAKLLEISSIK